MDSGYTAGSMMQLPLDLKTAIIFAIEDLQTLLRLIRTCRAFYEIYTRYKGSLFKSSIRRDFDDDLLRKALAACASSRLPSHDVETVEDFLDKSFFDIANTPSHPAQGTDIYFDFIHQRSRFEYFARDICRYLSRSVPWLKFEELPLQRIERYRLYRAFCHLEIFSYLFRDYEGEELQFDPSTIRELYLDHLPPWELEELACILFIFHCMLDDLSPHPKLSSAREEHIVKGLKYLRKAFENSDKQEIWDLLEHELPVFPIECLPTDCLESGRSLWTMARPRRSFAARLLDLGCTGPSRGWIWAQSRRLRASGAGRGFYNLLTSQEEREWACPLWSDERLLLAGKPEYVDWTEEDLKETIDRLRDLV